MPAIHASYAPRPIRCAGLLQEGGWRLKLYTIADARQAWIDAILANPAGPDVEAYLLHQLNEDV